MPSRAWARASAASTSAQRARNAGSPNAARIAAVPNMSPNRVGGQNAEGHRGYRPELDWWLSRSAGMTADLCSARTAPIRPESAAPAPGSAPCRPFSGSRRSSSRDRHRAGPAAGIPRPATGSTRCRGCRAGVAGRRSVDGGNAVIEPVDQRHRDEPAAGVAEFGDRGAQRACPRPCRDSRHRSSRPCRCRDGASADRR